MNPKKRFKTPILRGLHVLIQDEVFIQLGELSCKLNQKRSTLIRTALIEFLEKNSIDSNSTNDAMTDVTDRLKIL